MDSCILGSKRLKGRQSFEYDLDAVLSCELCRPVHMHHSVGVRVHASLTLTYQ